MPSGRECQILSVFSGVKRQVRPPIYMLRSIYPKLIDRVQFIITFFIIKKLTHPKCYGSRIIFSNYDYLCSGNMFGTILVINSKFYDMNFNSAVLFNLY